VRRVRLVDAIPASHGASLAKHSFAHKGVPKCNLGTRDATTVKVTK
jgi:hypothetical protein